MSEKMWAIVNGIGDLCSVELTRRAAINSMVAANIFSPPSMERCAEWKKLRRAGYRCVRVTVTVEAP